MTNVRVVDDNGTDGLLPVSRLPEWEAKGEGFTAIDQAEVEAAREADGITEDDVAAATEKAQARAEKRQSDAKPAKKAAGKKAAAPGGGGGS